MLKILKKFIFNIFSVITLCLLLTYYSVMIALPAESCSVSLQCNAYNTISCSGNEYCFASVAQGWIQCDGILTQCPPIKMT